MRVGLIFFSVVLLVAAEWSQGANILGLCPSWTSHYFLCEKAIKGLANAGHHVTLIASQTTKNPPKNGSITDIVIPEVNEMYQQMLVTNFSEGGFLLTRFFKIHKILGKMTNFTFQNPEVQKLIKSKPKFDLVFVEQFENDALKIFAHLFDAPLVVLSSVGPGFLSNYIVGNPSVPSYDPGFLSIKGKKMSFLERGLSLLTISMFDLVRNYYTSPHQNKLVQQNFPGAPDIWDLNFKTALVLLNSHTSYGKSVPMVPNMIEIGGYHIDPPKALPKDLEGILDNSKNGVILFSMGSNFRSRDIPEWKKKVILNVFSKLKQTVLWKFEDDLPERSNNVIIRKWLPQNDVLAHRNVKLFITHGGILSNTETVYHGVPILVIPVFADQFSNADKAVHAGYALKLPFEDNDQWTEENLYHKIYDLLSNPKYTLTVEKISKLFHDRPMKPMETLVYWVEYVIRHKGAPHLRVAGVGMPLYKYFNLDVIGALLGIVLVSINIVYLVLKRFCCKSKSQGKGNKKLKKN